MTGKENDRRSLAAFISSMLIFGTIGVLRRYIPLSSALLFSALLLKEPLSVLNLIGAVLIIGSAMVSEIQKE